MKTKNNIHASGFGSVRTTLSARHAPRLRRTTLSAAVLALACNGAVWAQEAAAPAEGASSSAAVSSAANNTVQQDTVVVTGSRTQTKASKSLTPVDVISGQQLRSTGQTNLRDALVQLSPSIGHETYAGDAALLTNTLSLHGLSPDHVLVLVNGKRRHRR